jgi:hypothetical protein
MDADIAPGAGESTPPYSGMAPDTYGDYADADYTMD